MLRERLRPETIESQTRFIMHLISQQPMEDHACDCNVSRKGLCVTWRKEECLTVKEKG